jgi:hypothetical protein
MVAAGAKRNIPQVNERVSTPMSAVTVFRQHVLRVSRENKLSFVHGIQGANASVV